MGLDTGWPGPHAPARDLAAMLGAWHTSTRFYTLAAPAQSSALPASLMVESFVLVEDLSQPFALRIHTLTTEVQVPLTQLHARPITLITHLADGSQSRRSGYVTEAIAEESDGGLARKTLVVQPWPALLGHTLNSRTWQDQTLIQILEDVFADHASIAAWRWDPDVLAHVQGGMFARKQGQRSCCNQYRESDLAFMQRLLAEEGIGWRVDEDDAAPGGHTVVFFVSSASQPADATSAAHQGIRFHRASSQEQQDAIQALGAVRQLGSTATVVLGWDHKANAAITAEAPTAHTWAGPQASSLQSWLASYDPTGDYLFGNSDEARFVATRLQEAREARYKSWLGRSTVRSLKAGTCFGVTQSTVENADFFCTHVHAVGINNLPKELNAQVAQRLGVDLAEALSMGASELSQHTVGIDAADTQALISQARQSGFANQFQAVRRIIPWRPVLMDETGQRPRPRPTARGVQTAIVVGPEGRTQPQGAAEVHTDALGRIKVRFHWQANPYAPQRANTDHSAWVRVAQRSAGGGMGHALIPRIGQEVLVGFVGNDIDRPVVLGSLYNGRGESGVPHTPGGAPAQAHTEALAHSTDHHPASQLNLVASGLGGTSGNSPAWHGAAPGAATEGTQAQNNAAALSGIKSKEFGGSGHNQLVMDDTPGQLRTWLHTTQAQTWLQMGHLLHQADNHRGSFRGEGFELRTDAWGGLHAAKGLLLSSYALQAGQGQTPEPAGDNAAGLALARQAQQLAQAWDHAATAHHTVGLASVQGSVGAGQSVLSDQHPPAAALTQSLNGTHQNLPHMAHPNIALVGKAGVGLSAGLDWHLSSGDTTQVASGQDTHLAVGGQMRIHTGQAIGVLGGATAPGTEAAGKGLSLIAAQGAVDLQAQNGPAMLAARDTLEIKTAHGVIDLAAAKRVVLAVSGGASIVIEGGSFEVVCPGKVWVQAGSKVMGGPGKQGWSMPQMPNSEGICWPCLLKALKSGAPLAAV